MFWRLVGTWRESHSHLETRAVVKSGWTNVEEAFQHVLLFSYDMLNSSEVFLNVCSNEDSFSWPSDELMISWSISKVQFAWWNCVDSKLGCSFQILYAFQLFSLKSFSMAVFCLLVKTILLRSSELGLSGKKQIVSSQWLHEAVEPHP